MSGYFSYTIGFGILLKWKGKKPSVYCYSPKNTASFYQPQLTPKNKVNGNGEKE